MSNFEKIAPYLGNPLVLVGFALFLTIGVLRLVLRLEIFSKVAAGATRVIILQVIKYAFILAMMALIGGFALAAYWASLRQNQADVVERKIASIVEPTSIPLPNDSARPRLGSSGMANRPSHTEFRLAPRASRIVEGKSDSRQRRIFDITVENPLAKQLTLDTFQANWQYYRGVLATIQRAETIAPANEHSITFSINPKDLSVRAGSFPLQPTIVLPAASSASPSVYVFRLELLYTFDKKQYQHPSADWNLTFTVLIKTTDGLTIPLFREANWR
jgi:hypothetical protein